MSDANYAHSTIAEEAIMDELENGTHFGSPIATFQILSCANVTFLFVDRGTRPGKGVGGAVHAGTSPSHPGTPEELRGEENYQVGFNRQRVMTAHKLVFTLSGSKLTITPC